MKKFYLIVGLVFGLQAFASAQLACGDTFLDSGGAAGDYAVNESDTIVFCPTTPGQVAQLIFSSFDLEDGYDFMTIYDGNDLNADLIGEYTGTDRGGCGSHNFASVASSLDAEDLQVTGKTSFGDSIYELKNVQHEILNRVYDIDYNPSSYSVSENPSENAKMSYGKFVQSHPVFFWYDSFGRLIKFQRSDFIPQAECGKPVIYLYPETTTEVSVQVAPKGGFTKTEPEYGNGWKVIATPNSELTEVSSNKKYPYLFWEGRGGIYETPKKGFVVKQTDVHNFLVEKLTMLGLNKKEQFDFMEFWEPKMTDSPYYFVTFLGTSDMDKIAPLTISPKPDTVIRILMDYTPLSYPIEVEGYNIRTPGRKGFTVVEWGGVLR